MRLTPRALQVVRTPLSRSVLSSPNTKLTPLRAFSTSLSRSVIVPPISADVPSSPHPGRLENKVAIVTGASAGIGRAIALAFAREGAKVVCSDLHPLANVRIGDEADIATHDKIMGENGTAVFVKADVGEAEEVEELVNQGVEIFGRVDIMVNNAGIALELGNPGELTAGHSIAETPTHIWDRTLRINARGTFLGCKYAIQQMLKQDLHPSGDRGWVINLASVAGLVGFGGAPAYCASKGAIVELTRQVAVDYGKDKIHVNAICPGIIQTAMVKSFTDSTEAEKKLLGLHPWGKFGKPEDVGKAALFLASSDAAYVTGTLLPVDGGFVAE